MKPPGRGLLGAALGALLVAALWLSRSSRMSGSAIMHLLEVVQASGPGGWLIFAGAQGAVAALGILPASMMAIAAGLAYGVWLGFLIAAVGTMLGGWVAFALSRSLLRPWIARLILSGARLQRLDAAVTRDGWKFVCLMRISPVMPFAATSYGLGLTGLSHRGFLIGTLASLPALLGYVSLGALSKTGIELTAHHAAPLQSALVLFGTLATLAIAYRLRQMLKASLSDPLQPDAAALAGS